jgi:hypothetical protein
LYCLVEIISPFSVVTEVLQCMDGLNLTNPGLVPLTFEFQEADPPRTDDGTIREVAGTFILLVDPTMRDAPLSEP